MLPLNVYSFSDNITLNEVGEWNIIGHMNFETIDNKSKIEKWSIAVNKKKKIIIIILNLNRED